MEDNVLKYIGAHTLSNSSGLVAALVSYGNIVKSQCFIVVDHLVNIPRMIRVSNHLRNAYYLGSSTIRKGRLDRQGMQQVVVVLFSNDVLMFGHLGSSGHLRAIFHSVSSNDIRQKSMYL